MTRTYVLYISSDISRSVLYCLSFNVPMISFVLPSLVLLSESGAKIIPFYNTLQIFGELFSKFFFFAVLAPPFLFGWDCKDKARNKYKPNILIAFCQYVINRVINIVVNKLLIATYGIIQQAFIKKEVVNNRLKLPTTSRTHTRTYNI